MTQVPFTKLIALTFLSVLFSDVHDCARTRDSAAKVKRVETTVTLPPPALEKNQGPSLPGQGQLAGINAVLTGLSASPGNAGKSCRFGKPIPGSCKCDEESDRICGSDSETYKNQCVFKCAQECNPRLISFPGECVDGRPSVQRLDFSKKIKETKEILAPSFADGADYSDQSDNAGNKLSTGLSSDPIKGPIGRAIHFHHVDKFEEN